MENPPKQENATREILNEGEAKDNIMRRCPSFARANLLFEGVSK